MIKNFFKIAYRNILRNKGFSIINISGLAIGMASALLILLWVQNELSYDSFYKKSDRLYQVWYRGKGNNGIDCWNVTTKMFASGVREYPEVEKAARVFWSEDFLFTVGEKRIRITGNMVDPDFLTMFDIPFIQGDINTALNSPNNIVITENTAKEFFGKEDAMGKVIKIDNKYNFTVAGIIKDLPDNTNFNFKCLFPWSYMKTTGQDDSCWGCGSTHNYVLLKPNTNITAVNSKIKNIIKKHTDARNSTEAFFTR